MTKLFQVEEATVSTTVTRYVIEADTEEEAYEEFTRLQRDDWPALWSLQIGLEEKEETEIIIKEKK